MSLAVREEMDHVLGQGKLTPGLDVPVRGDEQTEVVWRQHHYC